MYAVVGCSDCEALWVIEGRPDTTQCPRCGKRHTADNRKRFVETDDEDHAREVRASMLAARSGDGDTFAELDSFAALGEQVGDGVVDVEAFLEAHGVDPDEVAAAGECAEQGGGGSASRREVVLAAVREQDAPGEEEVVAYAGERGVAADYVRRALEKLRRAGELTREDGGYRLL